MRSAECTSCLLCISACPSREALQYSAARRFTWPGWAVAAVIVLVFAGVVTTARVTGYWETALPDEVLFHLIPRAGSLGHP